MLPTMGYAVPSCMPHHACHIMHELAHGSQDEAGVSLRQHLYGLVFNAGVAHFQEKRHDRACKIFQAALQYASDKEKPPTQRTLVRVLL